MLPEGKRGYPASIRLKQRADFQRVYNHGVRAAGRYLVLFLVPTNGREGRFGVTASRRVGGAVVRSRCKRRLRELYRLHRQELGVPGFDVVANARSSCATAPWDRLTRDFQHCLRRGIESVTRVNSGGGIPDRGRS